MLDIIYLLLECSGVQDHHKRPEKSSRYYSSEPWLLQYLKQTSLPFKNTTASPCYICRSLFWIYVVRTSLHWTTTYQALLRHAFQSATLKEWTFLPQLCMDDLRGQICWKASNTNNKECRQCTVNLCWLKQQRNARLLHYQIKLYLDHKHHIWPELIPVSVAWNNYICTPVQCSITISLGWRASPRLKPPTFQSKA